MWVCPFPSERANQRRYHTIIIFMALQKIAELQLVSHFNTEILLLCFSSVQLLSHVWLFVTPWLPHSRLPCPSPTPRACSSPCPSSQWYYPTISFSVVPFSCLQSFPASGSFPVSQLFTSGSKSIGTSASASVLPMNSQDWFPLGWTGWIPLQSKGLSWVFSNTTVQKHQFFGTQFSL